LEQIIRSTQPEAWMKQVSAAVEIWNRAVADLARGIVSVINAFDPEIVVLGEELLQPAKAC
jgi:predicted NBD/HSP70 family sugar kinase